MKSFLFSLLFITSSFWGFAQKHAPATASEDAQPSFTVPMTNTWLARYEKRQTKMIHILGLTTDQKRSLDTFNDRYVTQRAILHENKSLNLHARTEKTQILRRERDTKFKNTLTPEQLEKWNELRKTQKKKAFRKK